MSYCRFSSGDVYLYNDVKMGLTCCCCKLASLHPTIFTKGGKFLGKEIPACEMCNGNGCVACMMRDNLYLETRQAALKHLLEHRKNNHKVPQYAIDRLREEIRLY